MGLERQGFQNKPNGGDRADSFYYYQTMSKNQRQPRWKQLGFQRQNSQDRSRRSSRYTPKKKDGSSSEKQLSFHHLNNSQQISEVAPLKASHHTEKFGDSKRQLMVESKKREGSQIIQSKPIIYRRIDSGVGSSLDHGVSSIYPKGADTIRVPHNNLKISEKSRQNSGNSGDSQEKSSSFKFNPKASNEENFKQLLKFLEATQRDMVNQRNEIELALAAQQEQFNKVKLRAFESFLPKADSFADASLKRIIEMYIEARNKSDSEPRKLYRVTSAGNLTDRATDHLPSSRQDMRTSGVNLKQSGHHGRSPGQHNRNRSNSAFKDNFSKIFGTLDTMKKGLNQCKEIRKQDVMGSPLRAGH